MCTSRCTPNRNVFLCFSGCGELDQSWTPSLKHGNTKIFEPFVGLNVTIPCPVLIDLVIESLDDPYNDLMLVNTPTYIRIFTWFTYWSVANTIWILTCSHCPWRTWSRKWPKDLLRFFVGHLIVLWHTVGQTYISQNENSTRPPPRTHPRKFIVSLAFKDWFIWDAWLQIAFSRDLIRVLNLEDDVFVHLELRLF